MKGLLKKEWYVLWNKPILILIPLVLFISMGIISKNIFSFLYLPLYFGVLPVSLITTDETSRWERFALGMPYSRKALVTAKYLMSVLLILGGAVLTAVLMLFVLQNSITVPQFMLLIAAILACSLILPSVLLPLNLQFGTAKARLALAVLLAAAGCLSAAAFNDTNNAASFDLFAKISAWHLNPTALTVLLPAAAFLIMAVSWLIAVIIYRRKQF